MTEIAIKKATELIKKEEGCRLSAYRCPANIWTIGYGHTEGVKENDVWTKEQADAALKKDVQHYMTAILKTCPTLADYPNQLAACTSLAYNIGINAFAKSTVARYIRRGEIQAAANAFGMWIYAGGQKSNGLTNRRRREKAVFLHDGEK